MNSFFLLVACFAFGSIVRSDCDWAMFGVFPLLDGVCSYSNFPNDTFAGLMATCSDDGSSATITTYSDSDCTNEISTNEIKHLLFHVATVVIAMTTTNHNHYEQLNQMENMQQVRKMNSLSIGLF